MSQPAPPTGERDVFEQTIGAANPELLIPVRFIFDHAPAPLNTIAYVRSICVEQDGVVQLLDDLHEHIVPEDLAPSTPTNSTQCDGWSFFGVLLMLQGKAYQALEVFDALYARILCHQANTGNRFHKGFASIPHEPVLPEPWPDCPRKEVHDADLVRGCRSPAVERSTCVTPAAMDGWHGSTGCPTNRFGATPSKRTQSI